MQNRSDSPVLINLLVLAYLFSTAAVNSAEESAGLDPVIQQLVDVERVGSAVISADGKRAVYTVERHDATTG